MHKNSHFNILQAIGNGNPNFVVIDGQRTDSGHRAPGAKIISDEMLREAAIVLADKMQLHFDEGFDAGVNDLPFTGNPFALGCYERKAWNQGYEDGRDKLFVNRTNTRVQAQLAADRAALGLTN